VTDKSAAVLPTPRRPLGSQKAARLTPRMPPADFGERLLRGRELKKRSLEDIAAATKIGIHQLRALERGDLHRLPAGFYRRAIVRQYAKAVGLDEQETLRDLASVGREDDSDTQSLEPEAERRGDAGSSSFPPAMWSSAAALVFLGAVAVVATAWYGAGTTTPAADAPVTTTASALAPEADAPAIALVAETTGVRANAGDIELATAPAVSQTPTQTQTQTQTETGNVAADDATEGELTVTSEPSGALVTVNGIGWGQTPVTIRYLPFGTKLIRATKSGYVSGQRVLDFGSDHRVRSVRIQLSPESPDTR
jgi:cytoskeletal protein RodZ